jgi:hypothetical protein
MCTQVHPNSYTTQLYTEYGTAVEVYCKEVVASRLAGKHDEFLLQARNFSIIIFVCSQGIIIIHKFNSGSCQGIQKLPCLHSHDEGRVPVFGERFLRFSEMIANLLKSALHLITCDVTGNLLFMFRAIKFICDLFRFFFLRWFSLRESDRHDVLDFFFIPTTGPFLRSPQLLPPS